MDTMAASDLLLLLLLLSKQGCDGTSNYALKTSSTDTLQPAL